MNRPSDIMLIIARAQNGVIGKDGTMPWHLPADLKRFKALTMGRAMIMGRKTFDSLPGLLPGRRHIVLTRDRAWQAEGAEVAHDVPGALALAGDDPIAVIGGAEVMALFDPIAQRFELTEVDLSPDGDTSLPHPRDSGWRVVASEAFAARDGKPAYRFVSMKRD